MAVSRWGDHAVEDSALHGERGCEWAAQPRAAQREQQRSLGPRQLDGRPPVGGRRGIVGQQQPRRARGASAKAPLLPRRCALVRGVGASSQPSSGPRSAARRGARVPARLSNRWPAGPPLAPPPRRRRRAWAARTPSRAAASTRAPAPGASPAARGRRSIWLGLSLGLGLGLGVGLGLGLGVGLAPTISAT